MLCPHCGYQGKITQIGFGTEYEVYYCEACDHKYAAYFIINGEPSELVPYDEPPHHNDASHSP